MKVDAPVSVLSYAWLSTLVALLSMADGHVLQCANWARSFVAASNGSRFS
jgi:hypothetical protein